MIILNDQGGSFMDVQEDITATLRAQDHGHPPVVCFVECNSRAYVSEESSQPIRAESHGAIPVVCLNFQGSKSNNVVTDDGKCYSLNAMHGHDVHEYHRKTFRMLCECSMHRRAKLLY